MKFLLRRCSIAVAMLCVLATVVETAHSEDVTRQEDNAVAENQATGVSNKASDVNATIYSLDQIIVTARKRSENVQEIPVAVTTITENEIIDTGLEDMGKVIMLTPGLNGMQSPQSTSSAFNIRGVGTLGGASGFEDGAISAYVDGVPMPIGQLDNYLLDVAQIEVLRGPQGTLYGKTAQGGAINITTAAPESSFASRIGTTVGTLGKREVEAMITGPLIADRLNGRLFFDAQTRDGDITNAATGDKLGDVTRIFARGSLDAFWSDRFTSRLNLSYDDLDNEDNIFADINDYDEVDTDKSPYEKRHTLSAGLINKIDLTNDIALNFVTGFHNIDFHVKTLQVGDMGNMPEVKDTENHLSQEIRVDGESGPLQWTTGLFGSYYKRDLDQRLNGFNALGHSFVFVDTGDQTATTLAAFGEGTYALTDSFKLTAGLRLNRDTRSVDETVVNQGLYPTYQPFTHRMDEDKTYNDWNGRVALAYTPTENHTVFGSISRGYKPGGYQMYHNTAMTTGAMDTPDFDESTSLAYELGYKGLFLDQRISLDATAFYITTEGEHVLGIDQTTMQSIFHNVDTESYGLELASRARVTRDLTLGGHLALTRAVLAEDTVLIPEIAGMIAETRAEKNAQLPNVPRVSYYLFGEYRHDLPILGKTMSGFTRLDFMWKGKTWFDASHLVENDAYGLLNLRIGVENEDFRVVLYADNLTDEEYMVYGLGAGTVAMIRPARGREVGVKLTAYF